MDTPSLSRPFLLGGLLLGALLLRPSGPAAAQEADSPSPRIAMAVPLAAAPGATTQLILRGWKLDNVTAVRASHPRATVTLAEQSAAAVPGGQKAELIGDKQIVIELQLPADFDAAELSLIAVTDAGESQPYALLVGGNLAVHNEQEPNNGFQGAQPLPPAGIVDGAIQSDRDVDVLAFEGQAGRRLVCDLIARRRGSGCDATLTLFDAQRIPIAYADDHADDHADGHDPQLELTLPSDGRYYIAIADANDQGGPAHPYRLVLHE